MTTLVLIWDNASWHISGEVRRWLRDYTQRVHREGGVHLVPCFLPTKALGSIRSNHSGSTASGASSNPPAC